MPEPPLKNQGAKPVPAAMRAKYWEITALTDQFCDNLLTREYAVLCQAMAAELARKRPSPLNTGTANTWACAIAYSLGRINSLFDKSQTPHMPSDQLCAHFGLSAKAALAKSTAIMAQLKMAPMDPQWTVMSRASPMKWVDKRPALNLSQQQFFDAFMPLLLALHEKRVIDFAELPL
jgi:hypothetical protein